MADRTVYGLDFSENGWRMVDQGSCVWVQVPGTNGKVTLQIREGQPAKILGAWAADWNAFIEPLRDADSACWTPTNSVASSNHLSGTAIDLNWNSHPFRVDNAGFNAAQLATIREMLEFYEGMVFWGNDWVSPKDAMHSQMNGNTYGSQNVARVQDFINRKIRADGFSTFRRGGTPASPASNAADILARAAGITSAKAQQILPMVKDGLAASACVNVKRIAMWLAQIGHESDGFNATEEYQNGDESADRWKYKGRTWIQITWESNYRGFSQWANARGLVPTSTYFVDNPRQLADLRWAGLGPAWYWTVARPTINQLCDAADLVGVTKLINGGTNGLEDFNGRPGRRTRYGWALALGDQLLALTTPPTQGDDELSAEAERKIDVIYQELTKRFQSRSPLRHLGEGPVDTMAGFLLNTDGSQHVEIVARLARYGDPDALALLHEVASADPDKYPDRRHDALLAQAILADTQNGSQS